MNSNFVVTKRKVNNKEYEQVNGQGGDMQSREPGGTLDILDICGH